MTRHLALEAVQQRTRRLVHQMGVLDHHHDRCGEASGQQRDRGLFDPTAAETGIQVVDLACRWHVEAERHAEQRQPRQEIRRDLPHPLGQHGRGSRGLLMHTDAENLAQQHPERGVRGAAVVIADRDGDPAHRCRGAQLRDEPRFSDPGFADDVDNRSAPRGCTGQRSRHLGELRLAPEERDPHLCGPSPLAADDGGFDRRTLALHGEGRQRRRVEHRPRIGQDPGRGDRLSCFRAAEQTRRQVHGISLDRVGAPLWRPEVPGEDVTRVHADADGECAPETGDLVGGTQHPFGIAARAARRSRGEHDLAAVDRDVGFEEGRTVFPACPLHGDDHLVDRLGRGGRAAALAQQRVRAGELDESDGDRPVLGFRCSRLDVGPDAGGKVPATLAVPAARVADRRRAGGDPGAAWGSPAAGCGRDRSEPSCRARPVDVDLRSQRSGRQPRDRRRAPPRR